ncbi:MAG: DNA polymerase I [Chlamydiia bacterium]|nr:DNA polymerase I [Chlamydiia bacterium]
MPPLFIIDASGYLYRSYFAIRNMTNPEGESTNALFGFIRSLEKLMKEFSTEDIIAVFDGPKGGKQREAIYPEYKAHRAKAPPDLYYQIDWARHWCDLSGVPNLSLPEVEADDTIGAIAKWAKNIGREVYLCTSDKDLCQLVNGHVKVLNTFKDNLILDEKGVKEQFGVRPDQIIDYLAITGDASDNVPGVPGIGPKGAAKLLEEYGTLENVLDNAEKISAKKTKESLLANKENALLSKKLVSLIPDVDIPKDEKFFERKAPNHPELKAFYQKMNFVSLLKELDQETPKETSTADYQLVNDEASLKALIKTLQGAKEVSFDTETTSENPLRADLVGLSFAIEEGKAFYVPVNGALKPDKVLGTLKPVFENPDIGFYGHNVKYDLHLLKNVGIEVKNLSFDTILASYILNAHERRHNLDYLALTEFEKVKIPIQDLIGKGKSQVTMKEVSLEKVSEYACEDADYTLRLKKRFEKELKERGLLDILVDLELKLTPVLALMERHGIFLDTETLAPLKDKVLKELKTLTHEIIELAGEDFNLSSPKQLGQILFEKMGIHPPKKTSTGFSTDADVLEKLSEDHPIAKKVLEWRSLEKLRSTYIERLPEDINPRDGRVHPTFNQAVAATGRLSCQDPNLQNIPVRTELGREIRKAFRPEKKGWSYVSCDYSQIELRLLAHLSEDEALIKAFKNNEDIHQRTAADVMGVSLDEVTKEMRHQAKAVNFGVLYGQGDFGLARELGISRKEAADFIKSYFDRFPGVKKYIESCKEEARKTGRTKTLTGRERLIPEIDSKNGMIRQAAERLSVNTPLQGTAADLIKFAMIKIDRKLKERNTLGYMILQIHDELIFEVPDDEIPLFEDLVPRTMQSVWDLKVPLVADLKVGKNWKEC